MYIFGAHQKCVFLFKHLNKEVKIEVTMEVKNEAILYRIAAVYIIRYDPIQ